MNEIHWFPDDIHGVLGYHVLSGTVAVDSTRQLRPTMTASSDLYGATTALTDLAIDISGSCNLNCVYCFEKDIGQTRGPVSEQIVASALDMLFTEAGNAGVVSLHFSSGEPLLRFDILRATVEQAQRRATLTGKKVNFFLNTNATLLTTEIVKYLSEHHFLVRISFDGPDKRHDLLRPSRDNKGTSLAVRRGLELLLRFMKSRFVLNAVLPAGARLIDIWRWARQEGIPNLHVIKVSARSESQLSLKEDDLPAYQSDLAAIAKDLLADSAHGVPPTKFHDFSVLIWNHMRGVRKRRYCGAGGNLLAMASDGGLYPCYRLLGFQPAKFGMVTAQQWKIDQAVRCSHLEGVTSDVGDRHICRSCWARYLCGGGCYADSYHLEGDPSKPFISHCSFIKAEIEEALRLYYRLSTINNGELLVNLFDPAIQVMIAEINSITGTATF